MRWEITNNEPKIGEIRFKTKFAFFPIKVLNKITLTDHIIWLELYIEEQEYRTSYSTGESYWKTVARTIHI
jgi:hypothetical protein